MGIGSLKPRLSRVLKDQILSELPNLIGDVESGIKRKKLLTDTKEVEFLFLDSSSRTTKEL
jgi:hypothetical protein